MSNWVEEVAAPAAIRPEPAGKPGRLSRSAVGWALHQGGRDPQVILMTIYIWAPYFATVVAPTPVEGQALLALNSTISGWIVALTAPFLGVVVDRLGPRKPGLAVTTLLMVPLIAALWWATPGGMPVGVIVGILALTGVLFAYSEIHHNAMLPLAAPGHEASGASGLALAAGNGVSVLVLLFALWAFALPGQVDWEFVPREPLFGLSRDAHEPDRVVAFIAAGLMVLSLVPVLLFAKDAPPSGLSIGGALKESVIQFRGLLGLLRAHRDATVFLLSRMLYADGKLSVLIFGGVFAAGVMGWQTLELLAYGVLLSIFAVIGGLSSAGLDRRLGPKRAVQIEILGTLTPIVGILGMAPDRILYIPHDPAAYAPVWDGPLFRTWPEVVYLLCGFCLAVFISAAYASSRTLLTRLAPADKIGGFFGLYALSGAATAWLGPMLVSIFTTAFASQRAGFVPIAGLLLAGLVGLFFVKGGGRD
jgi:UMF1 family MFS transporter